MNTDYEYSNEHNKFYHHGVTKAVSEVLGRVANYHGFWAVQNNNGEFSDFLMNKSNVFSAPIFYHSDNDVTDFLNYHF